MEKTTDPTNKPTTIRVLATTGGFRTFVAFLAALLIFLVVFLVGIIAGAAGTAAATQDKGVVQVKTMHDGGRDVVAILDVSGVISGATADYVRSAVDGMLLDEDIRAVVLRVDSPGGGVTASDEIWHQVGRLKSAKLPIIASYGGLAASGGYYISCGADTIIAQETTITGSIGVIAKVLTFQGLLEKLGVAPVTLVAKGSPDKSIANDVFRTWDAKDKAEVESILNAAYTIFADRVRQGRGHVIESPAALATIADGSVYTAQEALANGLIDGIGYLDDAVVLATKQAGLAGSDPTIRRYKRRVAMFSLMGASSSEFSSNDIRGLLQELTLPRRMFMLD
ncbi:MAG: signal peptide peptidase SppA [Phycisphaerales bacterium]|jgi:protease-4|nr:signal peptide peptidase SppA [Phycisphaerales bacterium]